MGCSPDKGGPGDTGNGGCSGTEEKIVSGGGELSECSQKFRTLEGRKEKKGFSKPFPLQTCCYCWQNTGVAKFCLLLLRCESCSLF